MLNPRLKTLVGAIAFLDNRIADTGAALKHIDNIFTFPSAAPDYYQLWCFASIFLD